PPPRPPPHSAPRLLTPCNNRVRSTPQRNPPGLAWLRGERSRVAVLRLLWSPAPCRTGINTETIFCVYLTPHWRSPPRRWRRRPMPRIPAPTSGWRAVRSGEHTSELQSRENLVCRLLLEKKNG